MIREWWATRRHGPMTADRCEVCHRPLRAKERVELFEAFDFGGEDGIYGGGGMSATYCKKDAPEKVST